MPITGILTASVTAFATTAGTHSITGNCNK